MADAIENISTITIKKDLVNNQDTVDAVEVNGVRTSIETSINNVNPVLQELDKNYASTSQPTTKSEGKIYCDTTNDPAELKFYKDNSSNLSLIMNEDNVQSNIASYRYEDLIIKNNITNPTYQIDITFDHMTFYDSSGSIINGSQTAPLTLDLTQTGSNGRAIDLTAEGSASEQSSKTYFIHLYSSSAGVIGGTFSVNKDWGDVAGSDKPSGATYVRSIRKAYAHNNSSGDFETFLLKDNLRNTNNRVIVGTGNGHGSTNNKIRRFSSIVSEVGTAITYTDSATGGASFTINENGLYKLFYMDYTSAALSNMGFSRNSTELTTDITLISALDMISCTRTGNGVADSVHDTVVLEEGDIIRPHTDGLPNTTVAQYNKFTIEKVL
jgi:hypothetical protein